MCLYHYGKYFCSLYTQVIYNDNISFSTVPGSQSLWLTKYSSLGINFKFFFWYIFHQSFKLMLLCCSLPFIWTVPFLHSYISFPGVLIVLFFFSVFAVAGFFKVSWMTIKSLISSWAEVRWLSLKSYVYMMIWKKLLFYCSGNWMLKKAKGPGSKTIYKSSVWILDSSWILLPRQLNTALLAVGTITTLPIKNGFITLSHLFLRGWRWK